MGTSTPLLAGDPAPWFRHRCTTPHGSYTFDMAAGRNVVLYFFRSSTDPRTAAALEAVRRGRAAFDDVGACFFGISADPDDEARLDADLPGIRFFLDGDGTVARLFGRDPHSPDGLWYVLDRLLRARGVLPDADAAAVRVLEAVASLATAPSEQDAIAPALMLPDVFEPEFCARLIAHYHASARTPSGVITQHAGADASHVVTDDRFKRRDDCILTDRTLIGQVQARIVRRVVPEIRKCFQFDATQLDRLILACYDSNDGGRFGAHRDNTVAAAAHRRFAVSININDAFEGGELIFPEFGPRRYRPRAGGAVVFSCSLMHAVTPVTRGRRFACLPFVYDEAAAAIKRANRVASAR